MTTAKPTLAERLRHSARGVSEASKIIAADKTARNRAAGDDTACYRGLEPEQTFEWEAADAIEAAHEVISDSLVVFLTSGEGKHPIVAKLNVALLKLRGNAP